VAALVPLELKAAVSAARRAAPAAHQQQGVWA